MLFRSVLVLAFLGVTYAFFAGRSSPTIMRRGDVDMTVALYFGTSTGNTENVASIIASKSNEIELVADIEEFTDPSAYDAFIFGTPTWHTDAEKERSGTSWDGWLYDDLPKFKFDGVKVAIFGLGDAAGYSENFCDAMGELYDCFIGQGATVFGKVNGDIIEYDESKSIRDGKFVGMPFDEDNESDKSDERAAYWVELLKKEGFPV